MKSILVAGAAVLGACMFSTVANATDINFSSLSGSGYVQDSPVSPTLFQPEGLLLSSGVVTACGGQCISSPAGAYNGMITGSFVLPGTSTHAAATDLTFVGVTGSQTIALYDAAGNFIQDAVSSGVTAEPNFEAGGSFPTYTYMGATPVDHFVTNLNWDGLIEVAFTDGAVPEPATWVMLLLGVFGLGAMLRGRKAAGLTPIAA